MPRAAANFASRVNACAAAPPTLRSTIAAIFSAVRMNSHRVTKYSTTPRTMAMMKATNSHHSNSSSMSLDYRCMTRADRR